MDRAFSVDEMSDQYWSSHAPPPPSEISLREEAELDQQSESVAASPPPRSKTLRMSRSSSEWLFQRYLQEAASPSDRDSEALRTEEAVETKEDFGVRNDRLPTDIPADSEQYQAFLKSRLDLACAAVALNWGANGKAQDSAPAASEVGSQASNSSQIKANGWDSLKSQDKDHVAAPAGASAVAAMSRKSGAQVRSTTSGSSGEQSDDDDAEGETETTQNMDPADAKRMRRYRNISMLSNRESARRSRRRKQAHLSDLETQVSQLRFENSSLLKRLTDISQKYNEAAVDNRVLKADVETLRAKVRMAEETVKRVTGLNPLFQAMSEITTTMGLPSSFSGSPSDASADASVPLQDNPKQHRSSHYDSSSTATARLQTTVLPETCAPQKSAAALVNGSGRSVSIQRVASLEHLQKRIRDGTTGGGSGDQ
ncbi:hypothetical protein M569_04111 [Genlisea aurea]|uniref:BZIP domain-containing protein n=1 Tax=Genlisea aurea TaxID=192259 RepID=S8CZW0_9LAMI|nr:hypothetical protein M569_04111 [Genlisea aurea]